MILNMTHVYVRNGTERRDTLPMAYEIDSEDSGRFPAFSGDGKWLVGWNKKLKALFCLLAMSCALKRFHQKLRGLRNLLIGKRQIFHV